MSQQLFLHRARAPGARPLPSTRRRCPFRGLSPAHPAAFWSTGLQSLDQLVVVARASRPATGQPSLTDAPVHVNRERSPNRREALCALISAATSALLLADRPVAAALVDEDVATAVFQQVGPSVASIAVVRPLGGAQVREVIGSGVVWDAVGPHVLTNFHIVPPLQGSSTFLEVTVQDASTGSFITLPARVAGTDSLHDLAVLRLLPPPAPWSSQQQQQQQPVGRSSGPGGGDDGDGAENAVAAAPGSLPAVSPIRVAAAGDLRVGQSVYSLGCVAADPSAPTRTLAAGLVSGLGRSIPSPVGARIYGVVQTEAVINAANSGGPLVDSFGRLVGLNTAVGAALTSTGRGSGVSFALPVELLLDLVPKIIVYGNPYGKK